ncbi:MAG: CRISPR-associated helicase Cas3', partial [Candidatus Bathyarchaeia archaeon]
PYHMANLVIFGATVIVMTATLPKILIEEVRDALSRKYPCASIMVDPSKDAIMRGKLNTSIKDGQLLKHVLEVAKNYEKPILLIFNTVERAVEAYRQLTGNGYSNVMLLHSRLISDVRKSREAYFEKNSFSHDLIVVATQVVEAGIDYDFKTVATELSPIDSLIQRIGRCARRSDGLALIFRDREQAEQVYPRIVIEETTKVLNEDYLAESVRNVITASNLVNAVYHKESVEKLREEAHDEIMKTLSFIKTFSDKIFTLRDLFRDQAPHLLRLGLEIRCILLPPEIYQEILRCAGSSKNNRVSVNLSHSLDQIIDLLNRNTMSLSVKKLHQILEVPALKHQVNDEAFYLSVSVSSRMTGSRHQSSRSIIELEINKYSKLSAAIVGYKREGFTNPLIINPSYYIIEKDHDSHLGLVKPYG